GLGWGLVVLEGAHGMLDDRLVLRRRRRGAGLAQEERPLGELAREVALAGGDFARQLVAPRSEHVGPGLERVLPASDAIDGEAAGPAHTPQVRVDAVQLGLAVAGVAGPAIPDDGAQQIVSVAEDVGRDRDGVADASLHRVLPGVDDRRRVLDLDARRWLLRRRHRLLAGTRRGTSRRTGHIPKVSRRPHRVNSEAGLFTLRGAVSEPARAPRRGPGGGPNQLDTRKRVAAG